VDRAYGRLLALQSILAAANSMGVVFAITFFVDQGGFASRDVVLLNLFAFGVSSLACVGFARARPMRARPLMAAGLAVLAGSYAAYLVLHGWPLMAFVAVAWGAYVPLFFLPFNVLVIRRTRIEDRARKIGMLVLTYTAVAIVGPTIGGAIVDAFGHGTLFAISAAISAAGIAFLAFVDGGEPVSFRFAFHRTGPRTTAALFAEGAFEGMSFGVIPLIAYAFTAEASQIGNLFSLFALAGGVVTVLLGVMSDRMRNRAPFVVLGAVASAAAAVLVVRAPSLADFAIGNSLLSLTASVAPIFLFAIAVERLPDDPAGAIVTREVLLNAGRTASLAAYFFLVALGVTAQGAFVVAAVSLAFVALGRSGNASR
jgi:predicted MFS family arabinose efflux permease